MEESVYRCRTECIYRKDTEVDEEQPEEYPIKFRTLWLKPESHHISRECNNISMSLRTVAKQDDISHHHSKSLYSETEITPALFEPKEHSSNHHKHRELHKTEVGQQQRLQARCIKKPRVISCTAMRLIGTPHILIKHEHVVECRIDGWQQ